MSYCLNPVCTQPQNPDVTFCQSCGVKLLLRERYRAVRQIGQGGFGKTFLAVDQDLPNKPACVIKQFSPSPPIQRASGLQKATELFKQEAEQLKNLGKHEQIPSFWDYFEQDGRLYLVQEYVKGRNLAEELEKDGAFSEAKIQELLAGLLPVLQYIHDNQVIHRDIKPENIIRRNDGVLFLVDFGAVKLVTGSALLRVGTAIGDPRYMPSEQVRGKVNFTSDLYALGVTCLHLITGVDEPTDLFDRDDKCVWRDYSVNNPISQALGMVLDKMVMTAMEYRYDSASSILKVLGIRYINSAKKIPNTQPVKLTQLTITTNYSASSKPPKLIPMGNKWTYENEFGKIITDANTLFEEAEEFSEGLAAVKRNGKWGFIGKTGKFAIELQFDQAYSFKNGLARAKIGKCFYFIDVNGKIIFTAQCDFIDDFKDGFAKFSPDESYVFGKSPISSGESPIISGEIPDPLSLSYRFSRGKYGLIDRNLTVVLEPQFDFIEDFKDGFAFAKVTLNYKYGLIDRTPQVVLEPQFNFIGDFKDGFAFARVKLNDKYGLIDRKPAVVLQPDFDFIEEFKNGFIKVLSNSKYGLINQFFEICLKPQFDSIEDFKDGFAKVSLNGKYGLIDIDCKIILQANFDSIEDFKDGFAKIKDNNKYGLICQKNKVSLKPHFDSIEEFKDGFAKVKLNGNYGKLNDKYGLIDIDCKIILQANFDSIEDFKDGFAKIKHRSKYGLIGQKTNPKLIIEPKFDYMGECCQNLIIIGITGKINIWKLIYKIITNSSFCFLLAVFLYLVLVNFAGYHIFFINNHKFITHPDFLLFTLIFFSFTLILYLLILLITAIVIAKKIPPESCKDMKYGLVDTYSGEVILEPIFDKITYNPNVFTVSTKRLFGMKHQKVDNMGKLIRRSK